MPPLRSLRHWPAALGIGIALCAVTLACAVAIPQVRATARALIPPEWLIAVNGYRLSYRYDHSVRIQAADGVLLAASLYLPKDELGSLPTVLLRVPYGRKSYPEALHAVELFVPRGYAVMVMDLRGTSESGGEQLPYRHATADGTATLDWIVQQSWSNGRVGTFGCSALGETQFSLARARHPAHRAMIAMGAGGGMGALGGRAGYFGVFEGGIFQLASGFGWFSQWGWSKPEAGMRPPQVTPELLRQLPVSGLLDRVSSRANGYRFFVNTPLDDPHWKDLDYFSEGDRLDAAALMINTWGDQTVGDALFLAEHLRAPEHGSAPNLSTIIAPGKHCDQEDTGASGRFGDIQVANATRPYSEWYVQWFDHFLKGVGSRPKLPNYQYYVIGEGTWRDAGSWPPPEAMQQQWFLDSRGNANGRDGDGKLESVAPAVDAVDRFRSDPFDPVPSRGGPICCTANRLDRAGPIDQSDVETRPDVLVYTSAPLSAPLRFAGPLRAKLTISSSSTDTDLVARLVHVWPDGRATNIQEGAMRMRYRHGISRPQPLRPDVPEPAVVEMRSIAYQIPAGHRLRLTISSTSFPRLERNLNTGGENLQESNGMVAENRIHHGPSHASWVELPVIP